MNASRLVSMAVGGIAWVLVWGAAPGCAPSVGAYCNRVCDCTGCDDSEHDECVTTFNDQREVARKASCEAEFNDALSCANTGFTCTGERPGFSGCDAEATKLSECSGGSAVFGNACEAAAALYIGHYEECTGQQIENTSNGTSCTAEEGRLVLCAAGCYAETSCAFVNGTGSSEESTAYADCVTTCY